MWKSICRNRAVNRLSTRRSFGSKDKMALETLLAAAGCSSASSDSTRALVPPIYLSTTFERNEDLQLRDFNYSRLDNPTRHLFEQTICDLEGGHASLAFSSGMSASSALFMSEPKAHIILPDDLYHGNALLLQELMPWLTTERVDMCDASLVKASLVKAAEDKRRTFLWIGTLP